MLIPGIIYYIVFRFTPMFGLISAFQNYQPFLGFSKSPWVGLTHFKRFFHEPMFWTLLRNTFILGLMNILLFFPLPIILALLINELKNSFYKNAVQTIVYIPHLVSWVIEALKYRIKQGNNAVVFYEKIQFNQSVSPVSYLESQREFINAVKTFNEEQAVYWLDIFLDNVFQMQVNHLEYQIPVAGTLIELITIVQESDANCDLIHNNGHESLLEQLFKLQTREEIQVWFKNMIIQPFICILREVNDTRSKKIVSEMISMVQEKYDQELSIEICAASMNYHPSYLRRIFLKETGENFGEYLTNYRMEIAKEWLKESDMRVFDIAQRLQYSNSQNFIRCFKRYTGFTPGQYRNK